MIVGVTAPGMSGTNSTRWSVLSVGLMLMRKTLMRDSKQVVSRTQPVPGTHLTELQLTEMWYQHMEQLNPDCIHRAVSRLFPRSRVDLIQYYTEQDLASR